MLVAESIDILSVCTPSDQRLPILQAAVESGIKIIFCEKPLAETMEEATQIQSLISRHGAVMAVNYLRRWDPGIREACRLIKDGKIGTLQSVVAHYGKGIANNGSHIIDLLNYFFGLPIRVRVLRKADDDYSSSDPTLDCVLEYESGSGRFPVYMLAADYRYFSLFELDILGTAGRLQVANKGQEIKLYAVSEDMTFQGYSGLQHSRTIPSDLGRALFYAVEELADVFQERCLRPQCGIDEAVDVVRVVAALKASIELSSFVGIKER
jgi:predicted dehydrogenase